MSRCTFPTFRLPKYFYALNDLHNFGIDIETIKSFFKPELLTQFQTQEKDFDYSHRINNNIIDPSSALSAISDIQKWDSKNYPDTVVENKQILNEYLRLLNSFGIIPILVIPPMVKEYQRHFNREKLNELFDYLNELYRYHSFMLVNFWAVEEMFNDHDFFSIDHLNLSGAEKFSKKLNEIIMNLEG